MREVHSTVENSIEGVSARKRQAWEQPRLKRLATEDAELRRHGSPDLTVNS
ncbi:MAG: hypothetical protein HY243_01650 [Proteobacteria bacterium]|nr:hypothetical protein [Pseudomonadota bacterium]